MTFFRALFVGCLIAVVGCSTRDDVGQGYDAGTSGADSGRAADGGARDSGSAHDAGRASDAYVENMDADVATDSGVAPRDGGGVRRDAGTDGGRRVSDAATYLNDGSTPTSCVAGDLGSALGLNLASGTTLGGGDDVVPGCTISTYNGVMHQSEDVGYTWTAPHAGTFTFDTMGSDTHFDTILVVLNGNCSSMALACDDDSSEGTRSKARVMLTAGQMVTVVVDGYSGTGMYVLNITEAPANEMGLCLNGTDDDRDGTTDCADSECHTSEPSCTETNCTDGVDNDHDTRTDCMDYDCDSDPACVETQCTDTMDNDGDGYADCEDFDCCTDSACASDPNCQFF